MIRVNLHLWSSQNAYMVPETNQIAVSFMYHTFLYLLINKPTHRYNFLLASFFRWVKETNETTNLESRLVPIMPE